MNDFEKRCAFSWTAGVLVPFVLKIAHEHDIENNVYQYICCNDYLSFDLVLNNMDKPLNWYRVSVHQNITMKDVDSHPDLPWNFRALSRNPNLTVDIINKYAGHMEWMDVSAHRCITMDFISAHPEYPWDWERGVSNNPNITVPFLRAHFDRDFDWIKISRNSAITMDIVDAHSDLPWSIVGLSYNPNLTSAALFSWPPEEVDWSGVSYNKALDLTAVISHPEYPWNWRAINVHPKLTLSIVRTLPDVRWNMRSLSAHKNVTLEEITSNPDIPWVWSSVAKNPNLTWSFVLDNKDRFSKSYSVLASICANEGIFTTVKEVVDSGFCNCDQAAKYLSRNPNLMMSDVVGSGWDWNEVACHSFSTDMKRHFVSTKFRRIALLSLMDEDYRREEGVLDRENPIDLVFQSEYIVSHMIEYV